MMRRQLLLKASLAAVLAPLVLLLSSWGHQHSPLAFVNACFWGLLVGAGCALMRANSFLVGVGAVICGFSYPWMVILAIILIGKSGSIVEPTLYPLSINDTTSAIAIGGALASLLGLVPALGMLVTKRFQK